MMAAVVQPTHLALDSQQRLVIQWSDGSRRVYEASRLRGVPVCHLPHGPTRSRGSRSPGCANSRMVPVGNYAYKISFSDGHSTGIYVLDLLRQLGTAER